MIAPQFNIYFCSKLNVFFYGCLNLVLSFLFSNNCFSQSYIFAQLSGVPVNTKGWTLCGSAKVANVKSSNYSEILLAKYAVFQSGGIFYNQPVNLSQCIQWNAEFDFRIFDGTGADGLAFCFLDVPPSNYGGGGKMGIPTTANGLKVCFDQYNNCGGFNKNIVPKIEIRYGTGYNECWNQPTKNNADGSIGFIRSDNYNHVKITYNAGLINVFVNNTLYVTAFQMFDFAGYLGFTAGTGGRYDNHSIKNAIFYTTSPPSSATNAYAFYGQAICSNQPLQIGTNPHAGYEYSWSPSDGLNNPTISNPTINITNNTGADIEKKFYVSTYYPGKSACASIDSISLIIKAIIHPAFKPVPSSCYGNAIKPLPTTSNEGVTGTWSPAINNKQTTSYTFTPEANQCATTATINIIVTPYILPTFDPIVICSGTVSSPLPPKSKEGLTGSWVPVFDNKTTANYTFTPDAGQCALTATITITIIPTKNPQFILPATLCYGEIVNPLPIISTNNITGTWFPSTINNTKTTTYTFTPDAGQCALELTVSIPVNISTQKNVTAYSCKDSQIYISPGDEFKNVMWNTGAVTNAIKVSQGRYTLKATDINGCNVADTFTILAYISPVISLNKNIVICIGQPAEIDAGYGFKTYLWNTGSTNHMMYAAVPGKYWVTITDQNNCSASDTTVIVTIKSSPNGFLPANASKCKDAPILLTAKTQFSGYLWSTGATDRAVTIKYAGNYWLQVVDSDGCNGKENIVISDSVCKEYVFVPSGFTPNGDGYNDLFKPIILNNQLAKKYEFTIYDRWGKQVFKSKNQTEGWNGQLSETPQPYGNFLWILNITFGDGIPIVKRGNVVLIR